MHHLGDPRPFARAQQGRGATTLTDSTVLVLGERHLRDVVEDDVDPSDGPGDRVGVPDVSAHEVHFIRPVAGVDEVEDPHRYPDSTRWSTRRAPK